MLGLKICCKTSKIVLNVGGFFYLTYKYQISDLTILTLRLEEDVLFCCHLISN